MARQPDPAKEEHILHSATETFMEKGYRDSTVAEIAGKVGLTASNVYIYYKNKEELLRAVVKKMMQEHTDIFVELSRRSVGLSESEFVDICFHELEKIRPRILFIIQSYLLPSLKHVFEDIDLDYSKVFTPYLKKLPENKSKVITRTIMALSDSFFLVGDKETVKAAVVAVLKNSH